MVLRLMDASTEAPDRVLGWTSLGEVGISHCSSILSRLVGLQFCWLVLVEVLGERLYSAMLGSSSTLSLVGSVGKWLRGGIEDCSSAWP